MPDPNEFVPESISDLADAALDRLAEETPNDLTVEELETIALRSKLRELARLYDPMRVAVEAIRLAGGPKLVGRATLPEGFTTDPAILQIENLQREIAALKAPAPDRDTSWISDGPLPPVKLPELVLDESVPPGEIEFRDPITGKVVERLEVKGWEDPATSDPILDEQTVLRQMHEMASRPPRPDVEAISHAEYLRRLDRAWIDPVLRRAGPASSFLESLILGIDWTRPVEFVWNPPALRTEPAAEDPLDDQRSPSEIADAFARVTAAEDRLTAVRAVAARLDADEDPLEPLDDAGARCPRCGEMIGGLDPEDVDPESGYALNECGPCDEALGLEAHVADEQAYHAEEDPDA